MNFKSCGDADDEHLAGPKATTARATTSTAPRQHNDNKNHPISGCTSCSVQPSLATNEKSDRQVDRPAYLVRGRPTAAAAANRIGVGGHYADETSIPSHGAAALGFAALNLKLSSPSRWLLFSNLAAWLLCIHQAILLPLDCQAKVTTTATAAHLYEELIEGRLDTSQLCGTRYSANEAGNGNNNNNNNNLLYIVGGDQVEDEQFWPWSVAIYELDPLNRHKEFICSGSLISDKFILTAAHCIQQSRFDILGAHEVFLKIAAVRLDDDRAHFYNVASVHIHPEYSVQRKANDIALLRLGASQRLPMRARPICLPSTMANRIDFTDQQVTIIGWGKTNAMQGDEPTRLVDIDDPNFADQDDANNGSVDQEFDTSSSAQGTSRKKRRVKSKSNGDVDDVETSTRDTQTNDTLLQAEVRVTNTDQCNRNYSKLEISWLQIDEHFLCASDPNGKRDACQGDSGGPLMWNNHNNNNNRYNLKRQQHAGHATATSDATTEKWYQLGLVSFGHGCANSQFPGVYTRISYYMPWILKTINGHH